MEYKEDDYLMLSGIQHFKFCRRQWALIHIEQQWDENVHTVIGELMHKKVHDPMSKEKRKDTIIVRALPIASRKMGISGECDVVEFHKCEDGISLYGHRGSYSVFPVEYKKGKPKITEEDKLQLTAQAMCLEEMFSTEISEGAIFYGETRRRENVLFSQELREEVKELFAEMHQYYSRGYTPKVKKSKSCNNCSLKELCLPKLEKTTSVVAYIMLTQHQNVSGQDLTYFDDEKKQKYIPYVIEPSLGADRVVLAFLCSAYDEEVLDAEKNDVRTVLHFHPALAPVKIGVLPLSKKLNEGAEKIYQQLSKKYNCEYDDRGNIGKRYRRQDEIGTPFCVTYDFESENDGAVTIRDRDTMEQVRVKIDELDAYFADKFTF